MEFDARRISPKTRDNVRKLLRKNAQSFDPDRIRRVNRACAPLAAWVKANIRYSDVLDNVK
eukprot:911198-Amorphochlora_amoeboformis.AAC.1